MRLFCEWILISGFYFVGILMLPSISSQPRSVGGPFGGPVVTEGFYHHKFMSFVVSL